MSWMRNVLLAAVVVAVPSAPAQVPSALLVEDTTLPGAFGITTTSFGSPDLNGVGGFALIAAGPGGGSLDTQSHVWGSPLGRPATKAVAAESSFGIYDQLSYGSCAVDDSGSIAYGVRVVDVRTGDEHPALWIDDAPVFIGDGWVDDEVGVIWFGLGGVERTRDGTVSFLATHGPAWKGATSSSLYVDGIDNPVLTSGDSLPHVPEPITWVDRYAISAFGTHRMVEVQQPDDDSVIVYDGAGLVIGGLVKEGEEIRPLVGAQDGERWRDFQQFGCNEAGDWFLTAETFPTAGFDEVLVRNGAIVLRQGDVVDGETLGFDVHAAALNEDGDLAYVWDVESTGFARGALFFEDRLLLAKGDPVDLDGDGIAEATIEDFAGEGYGEIALSDRDEAGFVTLYFKARAKTDGETTCAFFRWRVSAVFADGGGALAGGAGAPTLAAGGTLGPGSSNALALSAANPGAASTLFASIGSSPVPFKGGTLQAAPVVAALPVVISSSGDARLPFTWPGGVLSDLDVSFQWAIQDAGAPVGVALSNALRATTP